MSSKHPQKSAPLEISGDNFPALRSFLHGYFHEDMADEYGTPEEAVRQFQEDADPGEWKTTAGEWTRFLAQTKGQPLAAINRALTGKLGSACTLSPEDFDKVSRAFQGLPPD